MQQRAAGAAARRASRRGRLILVVGALLATGLMPFNPAQAGTTTLPAAADSWVDAVNPTATHGSNGYLQIDSSPVLRAYLAFDVTVPAGETITGAQLSLTPIVANAGGYQVRTSDTSWAEATLSYSTAPAPGPTVYATSGPLSAGVPVSSDVLAAVPAGGGRVSFVVDNATSSSYGLRSKEATTVSARPQLVITTAPASANPVASFTTSPISGPAPLAVSFTDTSTGSPTSWAWDFGDGSTSTLQNPSHTFAAGSWTVQLTVSNAEGSSTASRLVTATSVTADIGVVGPSTAGAGPAPTGEKPQSKLWFNDGLWWADLYSSSAGAHRIFVLNRATQQWVDTGVTLDDRPGTKADALWDGSNLYVVSHVFAASSSAVATGNPTRLYRYSYTSAGGYTLDSGFPTTVNDVSAEAVVLSKDSTGTLWTTWTQSNATYINRSAVGGTSWGTPFVLPSPGASGLRADDIAAVVSYGGNRTAVVWSNQTSSVLWFGTHSDTSAAASGWSFKQIAKGSKQVDDHISLRSLDQDSSGRLYAVVKTSSNEASPLDPSAALVKLFVRSTSGAWSSSTVGQVADNHTRPILMLDSTHQRVYVFLTGPSTAGSGAFEGTIYMKSAPMSALSFPTGLGTPVIRDQDSAFLNNVTSTKQTITQASGLVVLASNDRTQRYWHADIDLAP